MSIKKIIHVLLSGYGKMGKEIEKMLHQHSCYQMVGICDSTEDLKKVLQEAKPDMVIDFSTPEAAYINTKMIIEHGAHPVIGTTGLSSENIENLIHFSREKKLGGIIAPNFSISAVLMMKYAAEIAKFLPQVEIIERHHETKKDAPSGTAIKAAQLIAAHRQQSEPLPFIETVSHVRDGQCEGIPIHSIRLPGCVADLDIIFGNVGETLTLTHHTISREAFMPGLHFACQKVLDLKEVVYGLEYLLV